MGGRQGRVCLWRHRQGLGGLGLGGGMLWQEQGKGIQEHSSPLAHSGGTDAVWMYLVGFTSQFPMEKKDNGMEGDG